MPLFYAKEGPIGPDGKPTIVGELVSGAQKGAAGEPGKDGPVGPAGKSAYQYALDGGYTGTEEEFRQELGKLKEVVTEERVGEIVDEKIEAMPKSEGYTKEETLSDETKTLYGMNVDGTPDEAFAKLHETAVGVQNLWDYCWKRRSFQCEYQLGEPKRTQFCYAPGSYIQSTTQTLYYSDELVVTDLAGGFYLKDPQSVSFAGYNGFGDGTMEKMRGKYVLFTQSAYNTEFGNIHYVPIDASYEKAGVQDGSKYYYTIYINDCSLVSLISSQIGEYEYSFSPHIEEHSHTAGAIESVKSGNVESGYEYEFLGSPVKNALAYYQLNSEAVLNALLGLEGITYE